MTVLILTTCWFFLHTRVKLTTKAKSIFLTFLIIIILSHIAFTLKVRVQRQKEPQVKPQDSLSFSPFSHHTWGGQT